MTGGRRAAADSPGDWQPCASLAALRARATLARRVREFFAARHVLEVETPVLSAFGCTDPQIDSLRTEVGPGRNFYLHTSPEFAMKRLLAAGSGDIYQICKVFRDGEQGRLHNPEFTMLEWYRVGWDHHRLMDEVEDLLRVLMDPQEFPPALRMTYRQAFARHAGVDTVDPRAGVRADALTRAGVALAPGATGDADALEDLLLGTVVAPAVGAGAPCFLYDFPPQRAALARIRPDTPPVAERFELFWQGIELCNGFHELTDPAEQAARFARDRQNRRAAGRAPGPPADLRLLAALRAGLPPCAGVALGYDRVAMLAGRASALADTLAFPLDIA